MDKATIKVLDTDLFFNSSPNTGEPDCICSRCHKPIQEGEDILRIAIDEKDFYTKNNKTGETATIEDKVHLGGYEFRLCSKCRNIKQVGIVADNFKLERFKKELIKNGFPDFTITPFTKATSTITIMVHNDKVREVHKICVQVETHFKRSN